MALAEQNSGTELQKLHEDYERNKRANIGKMQNLETSIANKEVDNSAEVRKQACNVLSEAVKALIQRKILPPAIVSSAGEKSTEAVPQS